MKGVVHLLKIEKNLSVIGARSDLKASSGFRKWPAQNPEHFSHSAFPHGCIGSGIGNGRESTWGPPGYHTMESPSLLQKCSKISTVTWKVETLQITAGENCKAHTATI